MDSLSLFKIIIPGTTNLEIVEYYRSARYFLEGQVPYQDFYWEYPPGFLWLLILFRSVVNNINTFRIIWFVFLCLCLVGIIFIFLSYLDRQIKRYSTWLVPVAIMLMVSLALTANKSFINPDVFVSLLILVAFLIMDKNRAFGSSILLGWAAVIRVYPGLFWGLILLKRNSWKTKNWQILLFFIPWMITFFYLGGWPVVEGFVHSFLAQMNRPVHIESWCGSMMLIYHWLGSQVYTTVQPEYMSINLNFSQVPFSWALFRWIKWLPLMYSAYLIIKNNQYLFEKKWLFYQLCLLSVISLLIAHSVLSPQYLIWLWIPWGLWLIEGYKAKRIRKWLIVINVLVMIMIHLLNSIYLTYYAAEKINLLLNLDNVPGWLIVTRNSLIMLLWLITAINLKRSTLVKEKK